MLLRMMIFFVDDSVGSFNQGYGELFDEDMGVVYFDENFVNYSLIDDNSKFISSRNRNSPISFSVGDIGRAAQSVLSYVNANQRLSGTVSVAGVRVNMNDFLYLLCKSLNTTENITYINYNHVSSISGTNKPGLFISKNVYKSIAASIVQCYEINGRNPLNLHYNNITISFEDTVYLYTRIVRYNYAHGRYSSTAGIKALSNYDYSTESEALASNTSQAFTITANCVSNGDGTYNLTLTPSQNAVVYYTRNGTLPTTQSKVYNGTLRIYNNTWVRFFGINNNGQTPILSYGVYRASFPYFTRKPVFQSNGYNYKVYLSTSQQAIIYYTLNGSKPTTQSLVYNGSITVHNYTLLQYFAKTICNNKESNIYYYRLNNPTPYVTILNLTDVRDNHQNVTIIANKPGTIYYTRNGSTPTVNSNVYTSGRVMDLSIPTQLRAILVDTNNQTSQVVFYQAPQIITPSKAIISALWDISENSQIITFNFNKITKKIYFTTDNSNPKNSTTSTLITVNSNWYQSINVPAGKTLKYYTISDEGYTSDVYSYKVPLSQNAIANVKIINFTNIYNDGTQKIGIQMDQSGQKTATINNEYHFLGACYEITTTNDTKIEIEILNNHSNRRDTYVYTRETGLRYRMHFIYTMNIPYQELQICVNSSNIINLQNTSVINNLNNNRSYFYNYTTKTYNVTTSKYINYPGMLIYKSGNNITIDFYNYTYGNTNQVSIIKELIGTKLIKVSMINNAIKTEIATIYLPELNYIDCYFKSNDFYKKDYIKDFLSSSEINGKTLETVQTYVLSNQKIDYRIINKTLQKYNLYNQSVFKSAYGTYLTGLTHMYLFNSITTFFSCKLNVTTYNFKDTQMRVNIDINGRTYVDIDDENYGTRLISDNETNAKIYNILGGFYGSYLEGLVLNLAGDNNSYSAIKYFTEDLLSNNLLNFSYNNQTNKLTITTLNNNDYYIYINEDGSYSFTILNNRYENLRNINSGNSNDTEENVTDINGLLGGGGSSGYGWNYEEIATENIMNFLIEDLNIKITYATNWFNQLPQNEQELFWEGFNLGEDMVGSIHIATAVTTYALSAPISVTITCACVGVALCFLATGVNSLDDLNNEYYYLAALPSIALSTTGVGTIPAKVSTLLGKDVLKKVVWSFGNAIYRKTEQLSAIDFVEETIQDLFNEYTYNTFLNSVELHENRGCN